MHMARASIAAVVLLATGCLGTGDITSAGGGDAGPDANVTAQLARDTFETEIEPLLTGFCAACHAADDSVGFMAPNPDMYEAVRSWPDLMNLEKPASSALVTKGAHDGPAWTVDQIPALVSWINLEADASGIEPVDEPETEAFAPIIGVNTVDLTGIGLPSSRLTFRLEKLQVGFYISELMLTAGPDGAHVVHPLFVTWTGDEPAPDPIDRFNDVDLNVEPETSQMVGGGTLVMVDIAPDAMLSIHFEIAEPVYEPGGPGGGPGGLGGGCKNVAAFTANAQGPLSASCTGCHAGGDAQASAATDMTQLNDLSPEAQAQACAQILSRVNLEDSINSGIFIAPDPGSGAGHPFKFGGDAAAFEAFRNALLVWIAQE
jgi:hypothetical protein